MFLLILKTRRTHNLLHLRIQFLNPFTLHHQFSLFINISANFYFKFLLSLINLASQLVILIKQQLSTTCKIQNLFRFHLHRSFINLNRFMMCLHQLDISVQPFSHTLNRSLLLLGFDYFKLKRAGLIGEL